MGDNNQTKDVSAKAAVDCIRSEMSNAEVMKRFQINTKGYVDLLRQLILAKLITEDDLTRRGIRMKVLSPAQPPSSPKPIPIQQVVTTGPVTPADDGDQFLDTAALVDLLSFGGSGKRKSANSSSASAEELKEESKEEPEADVTPSKSRFSLTGLFKKSK
jgi:hypothetical protein